MAKCVEELELSVRSYNCLKNANIQTIAELVQKTDGEMLKTRNCTTKTLSTFLNDRIADGDLVLVPSLKQSRRTYKLKPELKEICESLVQIPFHDQNQQKTA